MASAARVDLKSWIQLYFSVDQSVDPRMATVLKTTEAILPATCKAKSEFGDLPKSRLTLIWCTRNRPKFEGARMCSNSVCRKASANKSKLNLAERKI